MDGKLATSYAVLIRTRGTEDRGGAKGKGNLQEMTTRDLMMAGIGAALGVVLLIGLQHYVGKETTTKPVPVARVTQATASSAAITTTTVSSEEWRTANANLAETVRLAQQRLDQNEVEKKDLEKALKEAKSKLAADGAPVRNAFDLTKDDWKELAKTGTVKARYPCRFDPDWHLGAGQVSALGLSPNDVSTVEAAYEAEENRITAAITPGCAKVLGNAELARRLGSRVCAEIISESVKNQNPDLQLVADIFAGNVAMPTADQLDPFATMLVAEAGAMQALQTDLATTLGPDDAHRLAFADELGSCSGSWGGGPPKKP
jgi:hypothetical protein